jgi:hypothetical protein
MLARVLHLLNLIGVVLFLKTKRVPFQSYHKYMKPIFRNRLK